MNPITIGDMNRNRVGDQLIGDALRIEIDDAASRGMAGEEVVFSSEVT